MEYVDLQEAKYVCKKADDFFPQNKASPFKIFQASRFLVKYFPTKKTSKLLKQWLNNKLI